MYGDGKSDRLIVAKKRSNNDCGAPWLWRLNAEREVQVVGCRRGRDAGYPAPPRTDPSERNYRTGLLPQVVTRRHFTCRICSSAVRKHSEST